MTHDLVVRGDAWDVAVEGGAIAEVGPGLGPGRDEVDARGLLVYAFAAEVLEKISIDVVREALEAELYRRLNRD